MITTDDALPNPDAKVAERPPGARDAGSVMIGIIQAGDRERNMTGDTGESQTSGEEGESSEYSSGVER